MKTHLSIILILFVGLLVAGCQPTGNVASEDHITIGGLFACTGYGAQWGAAERDGALLAITEANKAGGINGAPIVLVAEDTQTDPRNALNSYHKLVSEDKVHIIIGPTWEASASAIIPAALQDDVLVISPSSYNTIYDEQEQTLFSTYPPFQYQFGPLKTYAEKNNITHFETIYNDEIFSALMEGIFEEQAKQNGWTVSGTYRMPMDTADYRVQLLKVQQSGAQAVYAPMESDQLGKLLKQAKELGITIPIYSVDSLESDKSFISYGSATEGVLYPSPVQSPNYAAFEQKYIAAYGHAPDVASAANAYDATKMVIEALNSGARSTDEIAAYLHSMKSYEGASGTLTFTDRGIIEGKEYELKTVKDGKFVRLP